MRGAPRTGRGFATVEPLDRGVEAELRAGRSA
jgi:hypothetical protein